MHDPRPSSGLARARAHFSARVGVSCLASLAVHGAALLALYGTGALRVLDRPRVFAIALRSLRTAQWEANRGISGASSPPAPERPPEVVALPPDIEHDPDREERPPPAATRLAERDQTVAKQTVSRHANAYARLLRVPQQQARGREGSGERGPGPIAAPGRTGPRGGGGADRDAAAPRPPAQERAAAPADPLTAPATAPPGLPPGDPTLPADGEGGRRMDGPRVSGAPLLEHARPEGGPSFEGLGLEEGSETRLHTRRFEPAAYWTDVRAQFQDDWQQRALAMLQKYDPHEDTYFYKPRTVRIALTLDAGGGVADVHVVESSGLDFYDAIALAAVKGKQPYPPPPPTALSADGSARMNIALTWLPSDRTHELR